MLLKRGAVAVAIQCGTGERGAGERVRSGVGLIVAVVAIGLPSSPDERGSLVLLHDMVQGAGLADRRFFLWREQWKLA